MATHWYNGKRISPNHLVLWNKGPTTLQDKDIIPVCDNMSVVAVIKKGLAKNDTVMHLVRCLWYFVVRIL